MHRLAGVPPPAIAAAVPSVMLLVFNGTPRRCAGVRGMRRGSLYRWPARRRASSAAVRRSSYDQAGLGQNGHMPVVASWAVMGRVRKMLYVLILAKFINNYLCMIKL